MRKCLFFLVAAAIGCSSEGSTSGTTTGRTTTNMTGSGGAGGGGGAGGSGGSTGGSTSSGGSGGATGGSGGNTGGTGGTSGGASGASGKGGSAGSSGGGSGGAGGSAGGVDAGGKDASGGSGGGVVDAAPPPDVTPEQQMACTNFANAFCDRLQTCSSFVMSVLYGDAATCKQRWALGCVPNFNLPGTSASAMRTSTCAGELPNLSCDKFLLGDFSGTSCLAAAGTLANGAACGDDAQCMSTFCARSATSHCGTCSPVTMPGSPCVSGSCSTSTNTVCPANTSTCVKPKAGAVGAACVGQEECDVGHQVGCNTATSKTCIALTLSTGSCGANNPLNPTSVAVCGAGGSCSLPFAGSCKAAAADGQTCGTADADAHCIQPAKCIGGKCVLPDPISCK